MENQITKITLKNFKGFDCKSISFVTCIPNQITIIVGRNGAGKSTFCKAISYLSKRKIEITDDDQFNTDVAQYPFSITFEGNFEGKSYIAEANSSNNDIFEKYHIEIVDSPVYAKDTSRNIGNFNTGGAKLATRDIEIIKLKEKSEIDYSIVAIKKESKKIFSKCYSNLKELFSNTVFLRLYVDKYFDMRKQKRLMNLIGSAADDIESRITGDYSSAKIKESVETNNLLEQLEKNDKYIELCNFLMDYESDRESRSTLFFDVFQLLYELKIEKNSFKARLEYLQNRQLADDIKRRVESLNTTGRRVVTETGGSLVLRLPPVSKISNGERDLLTLAAKVLSILNRPLKTKQSIIVFDEIYDYLDGANLIEFQYLISELINDCKKNGYKYYFLLFTHIDPYYFNSFILNKKTKVNYLDGVSNTACDEITLNLLLKRENEEIRDVVAQYYFHYMPETKSITADGYKLEEAKKFFDKFPSNVSFYKELLLNLEAYIAKQTFDIFELCLVLRIISEITLYSNLDEDSKKEFLKLHGPKKLEYAEEKIDVPNDISLLRNIFNEGAHINEQNKDTKEKMLYLKLDTLPLRQMINNLYKNNQSLLNFD